MNVVVTGGGTSAPIDDVRAITNVSTGRFSAQISEACLRRGARVWHVHAPGAELPLIREARLDLTADRDAEAERLGRLREDWLRLSPRLELLPLASGTVSEYAATLERAFGSRPIDVAFLAMAVSDYEPEPIAGKLDSDAGSIEIRSSRTRKVIRSVRDWAPGVYLVGFKLLSRARPEDLIRAAEAANLANRADLTVANDLQTLRAGRHAVHLVRPGDATETLGPAVDLADRLVERVLGWAGEAASRRRTSG